MILQFEKLDEHEKELMLKTPILVSILLAGADGSIDKKEISDAAYFLEKQTRIKSPLAEYFREVAQDFEDKFMIVLRDFPRDHAQRNQLIVEELAKLNTILPKIEPEFTIQFYNVLKNIAHKIAVSTGGMLGMNAIDEEEAKYLELYMIQDPAEKLQ